MSRKWIQLYGWLVGATLVSFILGSKAYPATYNFYFNNAEQGDNSTSTPTVIVKDGKQIKGDEEQPGPEKPTAQPTPALKSETIAQPPVALPAKEPEDSDQQASTARSHKFEKFLSDRDQPHFRLIAGVTATTINHSMSQDGYSYSYEGGSFASSGYSYDNTSAEASPSVSFSFFPVSILGATYFLNMHSEGLEGELVPLSLGRDGRFQLALLGGGLKDLGGGPFRPFLGGRLELNFSRTWGMTVAYRRAIDENSNADGTFNSSLEAGMVVRL